MGACVVGTRAIIRGVGSLVGESCLLVELRVMLVMVCWLWSGELHRLTRLSGVVRGVTSRLLRGVLE